MFLWKDNVADINPIISRGSRRLRFLSYLKDKREGSHFLNLSSPKLDFNLLGKGRQPFNFVSRVELESNNIKIITTLVCRGWLSSPNQTSNLIAITTLICWAWFPRAKTSCHCFRGVREAISPPRYETD